MAGGQIGPTAQLANLVRAHRHRAGLTQQELAAKAGISLPALRDLEQGRRSCPRPRSLAALAEALDLDPLQVAGLTSSTVVERRPLAARAQDRPGPSPPVSSQGLWLGVLGPLEARLDGTSLPLGPPGRRAVLGLLTMDPGTVVRRDSIMDVLWGQDAPDTAGDLIQAHVSRLRKLLMPLGKGEEVITSVGRGYRLRLRTEQLDLLTFRTLAANAGTARAAGDDLVACDLYERALELWRGDPLADVDALADQPGVTQQRRQLTDVLLRYAELACCLGFHDRVLPRLDVLAAAEPLNESLHARLMIVLAGAGQQATALRVFDDLRRRLDREFGIYPSEELNDAHLRVLRQDIPLLRRSHGKRQAGQVEPAQLPAASRYFTGRDAERSVLADLLTRTRPQTGDVVIAALTGMAGIGKTALAVSWAHEVARQFPDGQLLVDLRGFCSVGSPLKPAEALYSLLAALGVPRSLIPVDTAGRTALYRATLARRRALIVLDNAVDAEQVRPLLPGSPGCLVLVTSRHRLTSLVAADGAYPIPLGGLTDGESYSLLARILGAERVIAEPTALARLIALCANLPLALCNAATRAAGRPGLPLATFVAEMEDERGRLDALDTGEPATSLRVVFSLSHARLSALASGMLQIVGMHPGPDLTVPAAVALSGLDRTRVHAAMSELCEEHLLTEHVPGRYTCHELVRAYAAESARTNIPESQRRAAVYRMLDYYLHTASAVSTLTFPQLAPRALERPSPEGLFAEYVRDAPRAKQWVKDEGSVLLALTGLAVEGRYHPHAWELPWAAGWFFSGEACWEKLADAQEAAVEIAGGLGDLAGAALAHHHLGWLRFWLGDDAGACRHIDRSMELATLLSAGRFRVPSELGVRGVRSRDAIPDALVRGGRALRLYQVKYEYVARPSPRREILES